MKIFSIRKFCIGGKFETACCAVICMLCCYLYAVLLSVHEQTHVYMRQALNHSINTCYASKLKKFHVRKLLMVDKLSTNKFSYSKAVRKYFHNEKMLITVDTSITYSTVSSTCTCK